MTASDVDVAPTGEDRRPPFSPTRRAGDWIAVSGQLGLRAGQLVHGGAKAETAQALANLCSVLEDAGAGLASVQKVNVFLNSMGHYDAMNEAYVEAFAGLAFPARTAVAVLALPRGAAVEIEAWAYLPDSGNGSA